MLKRSYVRPVVKSSIDSLIVERVTEWYLPKEKFVRRMDKIIKKERKVVITHKIPVPFTITEVKRQKTVWATKYFQSSDMSSTYEWIDKVKTYQEPELTQFIEHVMSTLTTAN